MPDLISLGCHPMGGARPQITPGVISRSLRLTQQDAPRVRRVAGRVAVLGYVICVFMKGILAAFRKKESPEGNYSICLVLTQRPTRLGGWVKTSTSKPSTLFISWRHFLRRAGIPSPSCLPGCPSTLPRLLWGAFPKEDPPSMIRCGLRTRATRVAVLPNRPCARPDGPKPILTWSFTTPGCGGAAPARHQCAEIRALLSRGRLIASFLDRDGYRGPVLTSALRGSTEVLRIGLGCLPLGNRSRKKDLQCLPHIKRFAAAALPAYRRQVVREGHRMSRRSSERTKAIVSLLAEGQFS